MASDFFREFRKNLTSFRTSLGIFFSRKNIFSLFTVLQSTLYYFRVFFSWEKKNLIPFLIVLLLWLFLGHIFFRKKTFSKSSFTYRKMIGSAVLCWMMSSLQSSGTREGFLQTVECDLARDEFCLAFGTTSGGIQILMKYWSTCPGSKFAIIAWKNK